MIDSSHSVTIVLAQINGVVGDIEGNAYRIQNAIQSAKKQWSADIILFPELALTGYSPQDCLLRPAFMKEVLCFLAKLAAYCRDETVIVLGHPALSHHPLLMNAASVLRQGQVEQTYFKYHLPNDSIFDEKRYFFHDPLPKPSLFVCKGVKFAITICEDLWHKGPAKVAYAAGAVCLLCLNASPFHQGKAAQRLAILRHCQKEAPLPICYVNWVGGQDEWVFDGGSLVLDAKGTQIGSSVYFQEALIPFIYYPLAKKQAAWQKIQAIDEVQPISEIAWIYQALVLGLRDYIQKNQQTGVVIGLSGGIDSALALLIAVDALGPDAVTAIMLPSRYTSQDSLEDARVLAETLKVDYQVIELEPIYQTLFTHLNPFIPFQEGDIASQNLQARARCICLMAYSNQKGRFLLSTTNKSELAMGYGTLYGDMAGSFAVLKDVLKTQVYALAAYRNQQSSGVIPHRILTRPPSAELAYHQVDQDTLPPYEVLDELIVGYVDYRQDSEALIARGFSPSLVDQVITQIKRSEYKRFQAPPGVKLSTTAFGLDWRYPLVNGFEKHRKTYL